MDPLPIRKQHRLASYDYSTPGTYFLTICTHNRRCVLSEIAAGEGLAPPVPALTEIGQIAEAQLLELPKRFPRVRIEKYVVMPNHIHMLLTLAEEKPAGGASPAPTSVVDVVRVYKSLTTRLSRPFFSGSVLFQRSFYDHIVRNDEDFRNIWDYIDGNPGKWSEDRFWSEML